MTDPAQMLSERELRLDVFRRAVLGSWGSEVERADVEAALYRRKRERAQRGGTPEQPRRDESANGRR